MALTIRHAYSGAKGAGTVFVASLPERFCLLSFDSLGWHSLSWSAYLRRGNLRGCLPRLPRQFIRPVAKLRPLASHGVAVFGGSLQRAV